ncbi:MAG: Asp-tRNA(Asn)/Glu-tRNA(Gln) amidotransferase subunit GatA, partial [Proteobacteria bacterium]|nr:Asp-tRNA(Asn)/Glu-tRNA(Gln) amidotransferase subunit GatA [Pseudomonadota bacterium]
MNPYELTIAEATKQLAAGSLSSRELTQSCLERIEAVDIKVKAFLVVNAEQALLQADEADKILACGEAKPLCGIPLSLKDLLCTKGVVTTCGSRMLENFIPPYDATVVEKLKGQGAVLLGKVAMDEFAMGSTSESCAFRVPENP